MIISLPVHTAVCPLREIGLFTSEVNVHVLLSGYIVHPYPWSSFRCSYHPYDHLIAGPDCRVPGSRL